MSVSFPFDTDPGCRLSDRASCVPGHTKPEGQRSGGQELHRTLRFFLTLTLLAWPSLAGATIIGPTDDWQPLAAGAHQLGISSKMVGRILAAGLELFCPGTQYNNGGVLNGWFLGSDVGGFYTNAHGVIEVGSNHQSNFIEPLAQCGVRTFKDLLSVGRNATFYPLAIPDNRQQIELASFAPQSDSFTRDRARLRLLRSIAGSQALALPDFDRIDLAVGKEVIMVSRSPETRMPMIQSCHIQSINLDNRIGPGQLFTDCDNNLGNSAGLYFVRDPNDTTMLLPIALHEGAVCDEGDHKGWDLKRNTSVAIMLGRGFFQFAAR